MKKWILSFKLVLAGLAFGSVAAADIGQEFDTLGGNQVLLDKAKALNPDTQISIVQDRIVSRRNRWELAPEYSGTFGGDTYVKTMDVALNVHYHINPHWSLGLKYGHSFNKLTSEGDNMIDRATADFKNNPANPTAPVPAIDYQKEEQLAFVDWYPIYGKMNLLDKGVAHFDFYGTLGGGNVILNSGTVPTYTGGAGIGVWWTQHLSTRAEIRYQSYKAHYFDGDKNMDLTIASLQMGWLL